MSNPHLMYSENFIEALELIEEALDGGFDHTQLQTQKLFDSIRYVDYYVIGSYQSPQLFDRVGDDGEPLGLNDQSWPPDLDREPAAARAETVYFTLSVPRDAPKPAPLVILGHGYTSQRYASTMLAGFLAKYGVAVLVIDGPSHGVSITASQTELVENIFGGVGLRSAAQAILRSRATDQNDDGRLDSGADFWTSYLFHTRDMVRQFALDYSQLVRIFRSFDGARRWGFDLDGDGQPELAGDFNGDGVVDTGGDVVMTMTGGSLGGIMSMLMGSLEPELSAIAPMAGGGGYADMGIRSGQGGVLEAFILRGMGPLYTGTTDPDTGRMVLETIVPDLNDTAERSLATAEGVRAGDLLIVANLANGQRGCGYVDQAGNVRAAVESDVGDATELRFYRGVQVMNSECEIAAGDPYLTIDTLESDLEFQGQTLTAGAPITSLAQGLGLRRASPDLRRFQGFGQLVLDPSDPVAYARNLLDEPIRFNAAPGTAGASALVITTAGDMNVPASSGVTYGRAAGIIDYRSADPRYGVPENQVLIDTYMAEAVHNLGRYTNDAGEAVHIDVENFSGADDIWGASYPRLDPPLRIGFGETDARGGVSAALFPLTNRRGEHGMERPGGMVDRFREQCVAVCTETGPDPCGCSTVMTYDIGTYVLGMVSRYLASGGFMLSADLCQSRDDCPEIGPVPVARDPASLE